MFSWLRSRKYEDVIAGWTFLAPAGTILLVFLVAPILAALWVSFRDWNGISPMDRSNFVGLENYTALLVDKGIRQSDFFKALKNTLYYVLGVVPTQTVIALLLATIVNQRWLKGKSFFRTSYYFPSITSSVAISLIMIWLFQKNGLINFFLGQIFPVFEGLNWLENLNGVIHLFLGIFGLNARSVPPWMTTEKILGLTPWDWISGPSITLLSIMLLNIWTTVGTMMIIYLAALQDIPAHLYEAAAVDGANSWQTFRRVTLPLLRPVTFFVVTLGMIGTFQVFDQIFVISSGGPAKTTLTVAWMVYFNGFKNSSMGLAAATAFVLFAIIFSLTLLQRRIVETPSEL